MLKKILVPVDGSYISCKALDYAIHLGQALESEIVVLHITDPYDLSVPPDPKTITIPTGEQSPGEKKRAGVAALAIAQEIAKKAGYANIAFEKAMDKDPASRILEQAKELKVDAIIMGNRGLGTAKAFLLGSVSSKIVSSASCPVFIVK